MKTFFSSPKLVFISFLENDILFNLTFGVWARARKTFFRAKVIRATGADHHHKASNSKGPLSSFLFFPSVPLFLSICVNLFLPKIFHLSFCSAALALSFQPFCSVWPEVRITSHLGKISQRACQLLKYPEPVTYIELKYFGFVKNHSKAKAVSKNVRKIGLFQNWNYDVEFLNKFAPAR